MKERNGRLAGRITAGGREEKIAGGMPLDRLRGLDEEHGRMLVESTRAYRYFLCQIKTI